MAVDSIGVAEATLEPTLSLNIKDQAAFDKAIGGVTAAAGPEPMERRYASYNHTWYCNFLNQCTTTYHGYVYLINPTNGVTYSWNAIETATLKDHGIQEHAISPNFHREERCQYGYFGFGTEVGRTQHVSTVARFYAGWGSATITWNSTAK